MIASLTAFVFFFLFSIECTKNGDRRKAIILFGAFLLCFFVFLDFTKVPDVEVYESLFYEFSLHSFKQFQDVNSYMEPGYVLLNILISKIVCDFNFFYYIYTIIIVSAFLFLLKKYSNGIWLGGIILVTVSYFSLFLIREYLAIAICVFSIPFILKRKFIPFIILMFLAFSFHRSSAVFVFAYFIPFLKPSNLSVIVIIVVCAAVAISLNYFINQLVNIEQFDHMEQYLTDQYSNSWKASVVPLINISLATICYRKSMSSLSMEQFFFYTLSIVLAMLSVIDFMGTSFMGIYRLKSYFSIASVIMMPDALKYIKNETIRISTIFVLIVLYLVVLVSTVHSQGDFGFIF